MDTVAVVSAVASVIAAVGVVWERIQWLRTRPRSDVRVKVLRRNDPAIAKVLREREWVAALKNWGTEVAHGVELMPFNCEITFDAAKAVRLDQLDQVAFSVDVDPSNVDIAWIMVNWSTPSARNRLLTAWFPVSERGQLAEVYRRQMGMSPLRRFVATKVNGSTAGPTTVHFASRRMFDLHIPVGETVRTSPPSRLTIWWRRAITKLFRVEVDSRAWPAIDNVEAEFMQRLAELPRQPGDDES